MIGAVAVLLPVAAVTAALSAGSSPARVASGGARPERARQVVTFGWLRPGPAPSGWLPTTTATSEATLFYPPGWKHIHGDRGTVTVSIRDGRGAYVGYLNVTPRQGAEQPRGWAAFRTGHLRGEGDRRVRRLAFAEGLRFLGASGSCVIDDYLSKVGSNPYREIACIVSGPRHTDVFIGAALLRDWGALGSTLERAASSLRQR